MVVGEDGISAVLFDSEKELNDRINILDEELGHRNDNFFKRLLRCRIKDGEGESFGNPEQSLTVEGQSKIFNRLDNELIILLRVVPNDLSDINA